MNEPHLRRALGVGGLSLYGLGTIIGAGIYVLVGEVAGRAGMAAPVSFVVAGALAALTGLSYAELAGRYPEAAGEAAYVREAFGRDWPARLTGLAAIVVAMVATASIASGAGGYISRLASISPTVASAGAIIMFTLLAAWGVRESVGAAVVMTLLEIGGLVFVIISGVSLINAAGTEIDMGTLLPRDQGGVIAVMGGAFLAFFAFAGFENMVNMAEETREPERTVPLALIVAIGASSVLYFAVVLVAVLAVEPGKLAASDAPLCLVVGCEQGPGRFFVPVAVVATLNGVLLEIILMGRVIYGMARRGLLPQALARVNPRTRTPLVATVLMGAASLVLVLGFDFSALVGATSAILLAMFLVINLSLLALKSRRVPVAGGFRVPVLVPVLGAASSLTLLVVEAL